MKISSLFLLAFLIYSLIRPSEIFGVRSDLDFLITKKIMVIDFNPIIESRNGKKLTEVYNWSDPAVLESRYIEDIRNLTEGVVNYQIVDRREIDDIPEKNDGFNYSDNTYLQCINNTANCHQPDGVNYHKILTDFSVCEKRNNNEIDELWIWGGPYFGYWESALAGPNGFWYNSVPLTGTTCQKQLPIMGFNYERDVPEMLEDLGHRTESVIWHLYGSWEQVETHAWNRYTILDKHLPGRAACGNIHYGPNSLNDYDWGNTRSVDSVCEDWLNYPNLTGAKQNFSCNRWGCEGYGFKKWWLGHLPRYQKTASDLKLNNWWRYILNYPEAKAWERCVKRNDFSSCANDTRCAWYDCSYEGSGGCFPKTTEISYVCTLSSPSPSGFAINDLKNILSNYTGAGDSQYYPVDGKINMLDAGFVISHLAS